MSSTTTTIKIALIGAGPASLTLANILQNHSIPFTVYEAASGFRNQGGSLDLHPRAGQAALKEAGCWDLFKKYARPESDVMKLMDTHGEVVWDENGPDKVDVPEGQEFEGRPEIDRSKLMELLYANLKPEAVIFNKKLLKAVPSTLSTSKYDLHFSDNTTETDFDLVVGGDGAWSRVRELLTDAKPQYSGITALEIWANDAETKHPWIHDFVGAGSMFAFGEGCAVQAQRQGDGSIRTYASLRVPEDFLDTCGVDFTNIDTAREEYVNKYFSDIHPDLKKLVIESSDATIPRKLYELPVGFHWPSRSGVALIGDSAHVMTPFAGVGVNVGMVDALQLAQQIIATTKGEKTLDEAIAEYEKELFPRAAQFATKTEKGKRKHFSAEGAKDMGDMLRAHKGAGSQNPRAVQQK
ncbi:hypothetical protein BDV96DRAFT_611000 [Lophiotrema nucula]|uniref:FAD-binding domain-containing protein n=1 Tax=Lophiotrema nucula TaxID=690887 RepID=A0A6A5ZGZ0_9PLEO|nr:hypothetical protein BDV96DRAFT_611000 [Lophiotrema nucula]